jgi:hypothetical protein
LVTLVLELELEEELEEPPEDEVLRVLDILELLV